MGISKLRLESQKIKLILDKFNQCGEPIFVLVGIHDTDILNSFITKDLSDAKKVLKEKIEESKKYIKEAYYNYLTEQDFLKEITIWFKQDEMSAGSHSSCTTFQFQIQINSF
jgi:DnaJ-domain-containing protein 1